MSVFTKHWKKETPAEPQKEVLAKTVSESQEPTKRINDDRCKPVHVWDGKRLSVDPDVHSTQNSEYIGKSCDCGKFMYGEGMCSCPADRKWEVKWHENHEFRG